MESINIYIYSHEEDKHWTLVHRRDLYGDNTIMSTWSFKRKRSPYEILIKHKARLCAQTRMKLWGVNYYDTYYLVFNWMPVRAMTTLSILQKLHTKSVYYFWPIPRLMLSHKYTWRPPWVSELMDTTLESGLSG